MQLSRSGVVFHPFVFHHKQDKDLFSQGVVVVRGLSVPGKHVHAQWMEIEEVVEVDPALLSGEVFHLKRDGVPPPC